MASSRARGSRQTARRRTAAHPRKKQSARQRRGAPNRRRAAGQRLPQGVALPGWSDLAAGKGQPAEGRPAVKGLVEATSTFRFAVLILFIGAAFTLYVGHVHATQDLLAALQQVRRENLRLHLKENRLKGEFDRITGPAVIYGRARALGLEEGIEYGPTIRLSQ